jgi:hypothetical protein
VRADAAAAERRHEVREAARGWRRAGAIDEATCTAIEAAHPDDRARLGPAFRVLVFVFTVIVVCGLFGLFALAGRTNDKDMAALLVFFGLALTVATEVQVGPLRRAQGGTEAATAFLAVAWLLAGVAWLLSVNGVRDDAWVNVSLALATALCAAAAWRWGYALFAAAAMAALFLLAARAPAGRLLWVILGLALAPALARAGDAASLPPSHRTGARTMAAVCLAALYLAVHRGSWDAGWVESFAGSRSDRPDSPALRIATAVATALVPLVTVAWGVRTRRRWLILLGTAGIVASLVTLRQYVHVAPLWVVLTASGAAALAVAAALRRYLESGPGGERAGFTTDPLFTDAAGLRPLELAVGTAVATPEARPPDTSAPPALQPGGGRYGGGGASGKY